MGAEDLGEDPAMPAHSMAPLTTSPTFPCHLACLIDGMQGGMCVEYAKTSRAACRVCGEAIERASVRIGIVVAGHQGDLYTKWQHVACTRLELAAWQRTQPNCLSLPSTAFIACLHQVGPRKGAHP